MSSQCVKIISYFCERFHSGRLIDLQIRAWYVRKHNRHFAKHIRNMSKNMSRKQYLEFITNKRKMLFDYQ